MTAKLLIAADLAQSVRRHGLRIDGVVREPIPGRSEPCARLGQPVAGLIPLNDDEERAA